VRGELLEEIVQVDGGEFWLAVDVLEDQIGGGEDLTEVIEIVRCRCEEASGLHELQEPEFVRGYLRVVTQIDGSMAANDEAVCLAVGTLELEHRYLGGDSSSKGMRMEKGAARFDFLDEAFESIVQGRILLPVLLPRGAPNEPGGTAGARPAACADR